MIALIIFLFCVFGALGTGLLAGYSDFRGLTIPNAYSAVILGLFPLCYALLFLLGQVGVFHQGLASHVIAMVLVFSITAVMFSFGILGAADSKLGSAFALWVGLQGLMAFLFFMALVGAVLALASLYFKKKKPLVKPRLGSWIDVIQSGGNKVPYGIAITCGAFVAFYDLGYLQLSYLALAFNL